MQQPIAKPPEQTVLPLALGERIEGFEIEGVLGSTRFSTSYAARRIAGGGAVALHEFLPHEFAMREGIQVRARDPDDRNALRWWMRSYLDRAAQLAAINHRGLVKVLSSFEANGTGYYVTEESSGETMATLLEREGTLNEVQLRRLLAPLLGALEQVHGINLLHRDLRPGHIWIRADGSAALANFGILRAPIRLKARTLTTAAAPPYSAPEEFVLNGALGAWSDIYALSGVAYRALSGVEPVDARERERGTTPQPPIAAAARVRASETLLTGVDAGLKLPLSERPQSIPEWRALLGLDNEPLVAAAPTARAARGGTTPPTPAVAATAGAGPRKVNRAPLLAIPVVILLAAGAYFALQKKPLPAPVPETAAPTAPVAAPLSAPTAPAVPADAAVTAPAPPPPAAGKNPAAAPTAAPAPGSGDLERLVQDMMARDKKALQDLREQQRQLEVQAKQQRAAAAKAAATPPSAATAAPQTAKGSKPAGAAESATAKPGEAKTAEEHNAAADASAAAATAAAQHAQELEAEISRLKSEQAKPKTASPAVAEDAAPSAEDGVQSARDHQKAIIARARATCHIPAMDLSADGNLTYENAMRAPGAERTSGGVRVPDIQLPNGRSGSFIITPDSCARMER